MNMFTVLQVGPDRTREFENALSDELGRISELFLFEKLTKRPHYLGSFAFQKGVNLWERFFCCVKQSAFNHDAYDNFGDFLL